MPPPSTPASPPRSLTAPPGAAAARRTLATACLAHALHDGYTDLLYVLLPLWQAEFALSYAAVGVLRALYAGTMAGFQVPASLWAERVGGRALLVGGTALAALGYLLAGASMGLAMLIAALFLGGLGSSVQHPLASSLVSRAYEGARARAALGTFNFSGDVGKMLLPALTAVLLAAMPWRPAAGVLAVLGLAVTAALAIFLPRDGRAERRVNTDAGVGEKVAPARDAARPQASRGFWTLFSIGVLDSATRMGFLTFLPFLLRTKGAGLPTVGLALTLVFAGGATGKFVCGFLGARLGVLATVFLTEGLTAASIFALLPLPLAGALALLPLVGVALNGTSSVLYGTVPELVPAQRHERAFGIFYTGTIGAGALSPVIYGAFSDALGLSRMMMLVAALVLLTLPLAWLLRPALSDAQAPAS
ncbi:MAG: MFS transporter [Verrucomicrobia bacterium]|nr:MFS transporter [Verrucomicrobiota bacterium]